MIALNAPASFEQSVAVNRSVGNDSINGDYEPLTLRVNDHQSFNDGVRSSQIECPGRCQGWNQRVHRQQQRSIGCTRLHQDKVRDRGRDQTMCLE